jgi:hypothetical protein
MELNERICGEPATQRIFWPGREPLLMCKDHAEYAQVVAQTIGCHVVQEPVNEGICSNIITK